MTRWVLTATVIAAFLTGAPAFAATIYVDDDGAQCPQATQPTVQGAVDGAAPGDLIRVCRGTYAEQVVVPATKHRLHVRSLPAHAAQIVPPPSGLTPGTGGSLALVSIRAEDATFANFRLTGPLSIADPDTNCAEIGASEGLRPTGIEGAHDVLVDGNHLDDVVLDCRAELVEDGCSAPCPAGRGGFAVALIADGAAVDRSRITGSPTGVLGFNGSGITVQRNTIIGTGPDPQSRAVLFTFANGRIQANDLSGAAHGVRLFFASPLVAGNRIHDNHDAGISADDGVASVVRANGVTRNGDGIRVEFIGGFGVETALVIERNQVRGNSGNGIFVEGGPFNPGSGGGSRSGGNFLRNNTSLDNGALDCRDDTRRTGVAAGTAGTNDIWSNNIGLTDSPNVCRRP